VKRKRMAPELATAYQARNCDEPGHPRCNVRRLTLHGLALGGNTATAPRGRADPGADEASCFGAAQQL